MMLAIEIRCWLLFGRQQYQQAAFIYMSSLMGKELIYVSFKYSWICVIQIICWLPDMCYSSSSWGHLVLVITKGFSYLSLSFVALAVSGYRRPEEKDQRENSLSSNDKLRKTTGCAFRRIDELSKYVYVMLNFFLPRQDFETLIYNI